MKHRLRLAIQNIVQLFAYTITLLAIFVAGPAPAATTLPSHPRPVVKRTAPTPPSMVAPPDVDANLTVDAKLIDAQQDSTGVIWAITGPGRSKLVTWNGEGWDAVESPANTHGFPAKLARTPSGSIVCAWDTDHDGIDITVHRGKFGRLAGHADTPHDNDLSTNMLAADNDAAWIVTKSGAFYRVPLAVGTMGKGVVVYQVAQGEYSPFQANADSTPVMYVPWSSTLDDRGRIWFYTSGALGADNCASYKGLLIWDGQKLAPHSTLPGFPSKRIDCIAAKDDSRQWISAHNGGLYTINIDTLTCTEATLPDDRMAKPVQTVFQNDDDTYFIAGSWADRNAPGLPPGTGCALWKLSHGTWTETILGIDRPNPFLVTVQRPFASTNAGLWVASVGNGAWLLPANGDEAKHLDWRCRFTLSSIDRIFHVANTLGGVIALELWSPSHYATGIATHLEKYATAETVKSLATFRAEQGLVHDSKGNLYCVLESAPPGPIASGSPRTVALYMWDGRVWRGIALPDSFKFNMYSQIAVDSLDRVWITLGGYTPEHSGLIVYDTNAGTTRTFPTEQAGLAQLAKEDAAARASNPALPTLRSNMPGAHGPVFSGDGRVAYFESNNRFIYCYDGAAWQKWLRPEVTGFPNDTFAFDGSPFYDKSGTLAVNANYYQARPPRRPQPTHYPPLPEDVTTFRWTQATGWKEGTYEQGSSEMPLYYPQHDNRVPSDAPRPDPASMAIDQNNGVWYTSAHILYHVIDGHAVPAVPADIASPFMDGRRAWTATLDSVGNAFIDTSITSGSEYVFVPALPASTPAAKP